MGKELYLGVPAHLLPAPSLCLGGLGLTYFLRIYFLCVFMHKYLYVYNMFKCLYVHICVQHA